MVLINKETCDFCGTCVAVCPKICIDVYEADIEVTAECIECDICVAVCPVHAISSSNRSKKR